MSQRAFREVTGESLADMQSTEVDPGAERSNLASAIAAQVEAGGGPTPDEARADAASEIAARLEDPNSSAGASQSWMEYATEQQRLVDESNRLAAELVREEQQRRRALEAATMRQLAAGKRIPPVRIARMPARHDHTVPKDVAGQSFCPQGERAGLFRMFNANGKPETERVQEMTGFGFRFLKDEHGRVRTRMDQVWMSAPPENWARYKAACASDVSQSVEGYVERFQADVDAKVTRSGRRIGASWVPNAEEFEDLNRAVVPR